MKRQNQSVRGEDDRKQASRLVEANLSCDRVVVDYCYSTVSLQTCISIMKVCLEDVVD